MSNFKKKTWVVVDKPEIVLQLSDNKTGKMIATFSFVVLNLTIPDQCDIYKPLFFSVFSENQ